VTSPDELAAVARVLAETAGISLAELLHGTLRDGLAAAAAALGEDVDSLARRVVARDRRAVEAVVEHSVVRETSFWRHPEQLQALGRFAAAREDPLSIWSAGCSTGEEPYSVAIALLEAGRGGRGDRIVATDVSDRALDEARRASYGAHALRRLPLELVGRWFRGVEGRRLRRDVRSMVSFARHNLVADPPPPGAPFDVVLCRNVVIYFDPVAAAEVLYRLAGALRPGGVLVLGPVELPLAAALDLEWVEDGGATLLRRRG
jgi:chemotaxis protein methyltransferase CheR